ncbi:MAG TPA: DUF6263 family protein [Kofleriaceae bacterium]
MHLRLLLIALAVFGCKQGDDAAGKRATAPDLQLVSAGNEPRQVLRYHAAKGTKQQLEIAVDVEVGAGEMGGPMPTIVMTLAIEVEAVLPTGMKLRTSVVDAVARDRDETKVPTNALSGPLDLMKGIVITSTMTQSGRLFGTKLDTGSKPIPATAKTQLAALSASFDQLMMPLPEAPVGVGAVWRNSKPLEQNGMKMTAVNSIELVSVVGDKLTYNIDTEVHGDDQTVKYGDLSVEIKDITGKGTGKGTIDLATLGLTSQLESNFRSQMQAPGEGSATQMTMGIVTKVTPK